MNHPQFDCDLIAAEKEKLIEQQAERIKELEAAREELSKNIIELDKVFRERTSTLAALRQRIADAKVVQKSKRQLLSRVEELSLIVKEDLL